MFPCLCESISLYISAPRWRTKWINLVNRSCLRMCPCGHNIGYSGNRIRNTSHFEKSLDGQLWDITWTSETRVEEISMFIVMNALHVSQTSAIFRVSTARLHGHRPGIRKRAAPFATQPTACIWLPIQFDPTRGLIRCQFRIDYRLGSSPVMFTGPVIYLQPLSESRTNWNSIKSWDYIKIQVRQPNVIPLVGLGVVFAILVLK